MKTPKFMNNVTRTVNRAGLKVKKYSPEILLVVGVAGVVTSAVMACKATTKLNPALENAKYEIDAVHKAKESGEVVVAIDEHTGEVTMDKYTEEDYKKDIAVVYIKNAAKIGKLYAPSVVLGVTSIACILASNNIIRKRNVALAAAYNVVDSSFKEYRSRVVERFGEELDRELKYNIKTKEIEEVVVNEDGTETVVKKNVQVVDPNGISEYARFFDEYCRGWDKDAALNLFFLRQVQSYCNDKLKADGHLFLNDVYKELGIPTTSYGQVVGWIYDEKNPVGDNYVDFGIYDLHNSEKRAFVNGHERSILLDFNVDGYILNMI